MLASVFILLTYIAYFLTCVVLYASYHIRVDLQVSSFSQIMFNLKMGMDGADDVWAEAIGGFFKMYGPAVAIGGFLCIAAIAYALYCWYPEYKKKKEYRKVSMNRKKLNRIILGSACSCLAMSIASFGFNSWQQLDQLGYFRYMRMQNSDSNFYQVYYANPDDVKLTFPAKKKNLIYIYLESMESSFANKANGGFYDKSLIPNLTALAEKEGEDFSGQSAELNGANVTENSSWTVAAMVTQSTGTPLVYVDPHDGGDTWAGKNTFLEGLPSIGNILEDNGYTNELLVGSPGTYAGRQNFFEQHGDYNVYDVFWAQKNHRLPTDDYYKFWGFEDKYLFEIAKERITSLAKKGEPFNFTMLTVDTHFPYGYLCSECPDPKDYDDDQMKAVIACSDKQVAAFVKWIQKQPFYDDTVVVISGDHLSMSSDLNTELEDFDRKVYVDILNGPKYTGQERDYTTCDLFPTTLAALGVKIDGNRLGLGTNLYSGVPTLMEQLSIDFLNEQIPAASDYYIKEILKIKDDPDDQKD